MVRPQSYNKTDVKRGLWTAEEGAKMLAYVSRKGTGNWTTLPKKAGLRRYGKSCRLRWMNHLRPDINHDSFTPQEEELILRLHAAIGSRWAIIAQQLPGRTDNDVKNYWNTKLRKKLSEMGIDPVTHKPFSQILSDYGNIGTSGFQKSVTRIGSLTHDLKNMFKPEQNSSAPLTGTAEPMLSHGSFNTNQSFDLLDELQAIKIFTEASTYTKIEPFPPHEGSFSSPSSSSSSTCSTAAAQEGWRDFLCDHTFLSSDCDAHDQLELSRSSSRVITECYQNLTEPQDHSMIESKENQETIVRCDHQGSSGPAKSFVDAILDSETESFMDFPNLLEDPFYN